MNDVTDRLGGLAPAQRGWAVLTTSLATLMTMVDMTIANTALPTIAHDVHASAASSIWVVNAFQLALTISIIPISALGDIAGYQRIFRIGIVIFTLASLACAFSHSLLALACARFFQGIGGAALTATSAPINRIIFPPAMLGRATGYSAIMVAIGGAAGPIVGGVILAFAPWPWLFALNIPVGIVTYYLATTRVPDVPGHGAAFDWISAVLSAATFGLAVFGFDGIGHRAPAPFVAALLLGAVGVGTVFVRRQLALPLPMFAVDLLAQPKLSFAVFACFASFVSQTVAYVALPFGLQTAMGRTPLEVGLLLLPWLVATAAVSPLAGRLADRYNSSRLAAIGLGIFALGLCALALVPAHAASLDIAWRMAIAGIGYGLYQSPNNRSIQGSAPRERSGATQGIQGTARLIGQTSGALIVAFVFGLAGAGHGTSAIDWRSVVIALAIATVFAILAALASLWRGTLTGAIRLARAS